MMYQVPSSGWKPVHFWTVALALFILQTGLIWAFAERDHKPPRISTNDFAVRLLARPVEQGQFATALFAEDPTLFQAASQQGFSGRAWMKPWSPEYHSAEAPAPDVWLSMNGTKWKPDASSVAPKTETSMTLAAPPATEYEPATALLTPAPPPAASTMRIDGALARRKLVVAVSHLPAEPAVQLLGHTMVELAVGPAGEVLSARLTATSGSSTADSAGLAATRVLRFAPVPSAASSVTWGEAVFSWQTIEPQGAGGR